MHYIPPQKICQTSRPAIQTAANRILLQNRSKVSNGPRSSISQRSGAFPPILVRECMGLKNSNKSICLYEEFDVGGISQRIEQFHSRKVCSEWAQGLVTTNKFHRANLRAGNNQ